MATVTLVEVQPRQASDAAVVTVRLAGGGTRAYTQRGQSDWLSGVARPPRFSSALGFDQRGFTGGALPQTGAVRFAPSRGEVKTALGGLVWQGARIVVRVGDDQNPFEDYPVRFIGTVASHSFDRGALALTVAVLSADLAKPVLSGTFAGTGGLEGDEEATGRAKRRSWGSVFNVEGFILDKANLIYEFGDPARKLTGFPLVKDKGDAYDPVVAVAWQGSADATLATLRATAVPEGGVAVAPSISCVKPWTRPAGPITADLIAQIVPNGNNPPAWIAASIVREFSATIGLPNENEAAAWQPGDSGIHAAEPNETAASILDRLLFPVSIAWVLLGNGQLYFRRLRWDVPVFELNAETVEREVVYPPLRTRRLGFQLNNRIHSDGEISATILASVDPTYADGTPIDVLRPAEAGANITENRSSAGFYGQGALATMSSLSRLGGYLTGFGGLSGFDQIRLGGNTPGIFGLLTQNGAATSDGTVLTSLGTAAGIFGQGLLATLNQLANGSQYLSGFGALSALPSIAFGSDYLLEQPGGVAASLSAFKTVLGTAAAFTGQGALSTLNFLGADRVGFASGGGNLVRNTKYDAPDWSFGPGNIYTLPSGFSPYNNGGDAEPTSWEMVNGAGRDGGRGIRIDWNTQNSTKGVYLSDAAGVDNMRIMQANRTYVASFYARGRGDAIGKTMGISYNVAPLEQINVTNPALSVSYQRYVFRLRWGENVDRQLFYTIAGATGPGGIDLDGFQIEEGDTPTAYAPALLPGEVRFPLLANNAVRLGSNIVRADGSTSATESLLVTALGIASGFTGQSPWATFGAPTARVDRIDNDGRIQAGGIYLPGVAFLDQRWPQEAGANVTEGRTAAGIYGQGTLATTDRVRLGSGGGMVDENNSYWLTTSTVVTSAGVASGFFGQGQLATQSSVTYSTQIGGLPRAISPSAFFPSGFMYASEIYQDQGAKNLNSYFPEDVNSNRTEGRTSAAIVGQGYGATAPRANVDNTYVAIGTNTQIDSAFARGSATWTISGSSMVGAQLAFNREDYSGLRSVAYMFAPGVQAANTQVDASGLGPWNQPDVRNRMLRYSMPVKSGDTIGIRALVGIHRCTAILYLLLYRADGTLKSAPSTTVGASPGGGVGGGNLGEMSFIYKNTDPEIAAAQWMLRMIGTGESDPYVFWSEPWLGKLQDGQTVIPPYAPGPPDPTSDQTGANTAAAIAGQTQFATLPAGTSLDNGVFGMPSRLGNYGGFLSADQMTYTGGPGTVSVASLRPGEANANVTEGRTSAGIYGQGSFATKSSAAYGSEITGLPYAIQPANMEGGQIIDAVNVVYAGVDRVASLRPAEAGSNVTEGRTSAAIAGQGALATRSDVADGYLSGNLATRLQPHPLNPAFLSAGTVAYPGGAQLKDLQPQEAGANTTENRTAAAIYGQGTLATTDRVRLGSGGGMVDENNSYWLTTSTVVTSAGVSSGFAGQGSFATQSYLSLTNTAYFAADGRFEASAYGASYFRADRIAYAAGSTTEDLRPGEAGANVTEGRTAAAIVGQQYLATNYPARLYGSPQHGDGYLAASAMAFAGGNTVEGLRPGEAGANVTEGRQAASIYGQSGFATASNITRDNIFSAGFFNLNAFSLGYSVTRSDGTTTVTESLVVTQVGIAAGFYAQGGLATRNDVDTPQIVENAATNTVAVSSGSLNVPAGGEASGVSAAISAIGRPIAVFFTCDSAVGAQFTATGIFQLRRVQNGEDVQVGRNFTMTRTSPGPLNFLHYVNTPAAGSVTYYVRYVHTGGTGNILVSNQYLTLIETKR